MKKFNLDGEGVLIIGASGGIGEAVARRLHGRRANLVLTDISAEGLDLTFSYLNKNSVLRTPLDATDMPGTKDVVRHAVERFGRLDLAMANAGIDAKVLSILLTINIDEFDWILNVDLGRV